MRNISRRKALNIIGILSFSIILPSELISRTITRGCDACIEAWKSLGKFTLKRYPFRYIEPIKDLPKVFIYGDSISIGYTEYTRASLDGIACVYRLHENGGSSKDFIRKMETFRTTMFKPELELGWDFEWDVIHFNVGLHDLKYVLKGGFESDERL